MWFEILNRARNVNYWKLGFTEKKIDFKFIYKK